MHYLVIRRAARVKSREILDRCVEWCGDGRDRPYW